MTAVCCNQCFYEISQKDSTSARMWLDLCAHYVQLEGNFKLRETRVPWLISSFRLLEKLGYISTNDGPDAIDIRVNGYDIYDVEEDQLCLETFCIDRNKHHSSWV